MAEMIKMITVPVDDSPNSLKSLDYIGFMFGADHPVSIHLLHVAPVTPRAVIPASSDSGESAKRIRRTNSKAMAKAEKLLRKAGRIARDRGFEEKRVVSACLERKQGIARDICAYAEKEQTDAVLISTMGRTRLEAFLIGETANKVLELSRVHPVWLLKGKVQSRGVLIAMDASENALRGVDHAGFMLSGTDCPVTLFYSKRHFWRFVPREEIEDTPELETFWQTEADNKIAPYMSRAKEMLLAAGIGEDRITTRIVDGSRNTAGDILKTAGSLDCGTIVMGRRGLTGVKSYTMGSVSRKVLENSSDKALWMVP